MSADGPAEATSGMPSCLAGDHLQPLHKRRDKLEKVYYGNNCAQPEVAELLPNPFRLTAGPTEDIEMLDTLEPGISKTKRIEVDNARTIDFMGEEGRVYATPALVRDIEMTCRELLLENLEPGEDSVGVRIVLDHMAATPAGAWVDIAVTVNAVEGRSVCFDVECKDALEKVAAGEHRRFVVDVQTTAARLAKKREAIQQKS